MRSGAPWIMLRGTATNSPPPPPDRPWNTPMLPSPDNARADLTRWLALAPLVVFGDTAITALGLGVTLLATLAAAGAVRAAMHRVLPAETQLLVTVLVAAASATLAELAMRAGWPALHAVLAPVLPLVAMAGALVASAQPARPASRGFVEGLAAMSVLLMSGSAREAITQGTWFAE